MGKSYGPQGAASALLSLSEVYDTTLLNDLDPKSQEFKIFLARLQERIGKIALGVNVRDAGYYRLTEFINGQLFFPDPALTATSATAPTDRAVFRLVVNFGALPNNTTKTVAHGLTVTSGYTFTRMYGTASIPGSSFLPIPYASATAANIIELSADGTNVSITTGKDLTAYTTCYVILEFIKQ